MPRARRAKRSIIPVWLKQRTIPAWLLYLVAAVLALVWSVAAYWILVPAVENATGNFTAGLAVAFIAGMAGGCGLLMAAVMTAKKIREG